MSLLLDPFALFYPMRLAAAGFMVVLASLYAWQFDGFGPFYYLLVTALVVYPPVVHYFARKYPQNRRKIELRMFLVDAFGVGFVIHAIAFAPLPTFVLITVALATALSVNGLLQVLKNSAALLAGIGAYALFVGINFDPKNSIAMDVTSSAFTLIFFMALAFSSHNRFKLLLQSEAELRERTALLEIEKLRSDRLLLNVVPARLAVKMSDAGGIAPAEFDPVTLLAIELCRFSRTLHDGDAPEVLAHLMHCFKAFDAIGDRFGLEKLKTMGDIYIAVAGLPTPRQGDAAACIEAALGIQEFLADLAASRRVHGKFVLGARISVHSGKVIGGVVETSKISYDVWGGTMKTLLDLLRSCADGDIVVSEATRGLAGDGFEWIERAPPDGASVSGNRCYGVRPRQATIFPVQV